MDDQPDNPFVVLFWITVILTIIYFALRRFKRRGRVQDTAFDDAITSTAAPLLKKAALPQGVSPDAASAKGIASLGSALLKRTAVPKDRSLDAAVYRWNQQDVFTRRDLLRSIAIFGASGSGKSSGSGFALGKAIVSDRLTSGLILGSKPEDREFWQTIFAKAGRSKDLIVFGPHEGARFNLLAEEMRAGADSRDLTQCILTIGETLSRSGGGGRGQENEKFWEMQKSRALYNAIEIVRQSGEDVSAPNVQRFITEAATSSEMVSSSEWQRNYHNDVFRAAHAAQKTSAERHDYELARAFWLSEYPGQDPKVRSSVLADVQGTLHTLCTGILRELLSTTTNVSPRMFELGKYVFLDMPIAQYGASGSACLAGWKFATQRHVLRRKAADDTPITIIWADEAQKVVNSFDSDYLAECRSHRGCLLFLTQSIHSFYATMHQGGEHQADAFLTNFLTKIFHAVGDEKTAAYGCSLLGKRLRGFASSTVQPGGEVYDELTGEGKSSSSYSERYESIKQGNAFMHGMRTGGPECGYVVDGWIIRSGQPFSNGEAFIKAAFSQRG